MKKKLFAMAFIIVLGQLAGAKENVSCYDQAPIFKKNLASLLPDDFPSKINALHFACENLTKKEIFRVGKRWESTPKEIDGGKIFLDLQPSLTRKNFLQDIDKIKTEPSLKRRLQLAYRQAIKAIGDFDLRDLKISKGPLEEMKIFGARGWDAQRVSFVAYAIHSILKKEDQVNLRIVAANLQNDSSHIQTWIQLRFANQRIVDLDPAESGIFFIPLFPRRIGLDESIRIAAIDECQKLNTCLRRQFVNNEEEK
jgi:hypothetical protein